MTSQIQRLKSKSACFERNQTNFLRKIWWKSTAWTTAASINRARVIGQRHRSQHLQDQRLRSATFASTTTDTPIGQSNRSQHQQGQSQQSAPPQEQLHDQRPRSEPLSPAPQRAHPSVRASASSTTRIRVNDRFNN